MEHITEKSERLEFFGAPASTPAVLDIPSKTPEYRGPISCTKIQRLAQVFVVAAHESDAHPCLQDTP